MTTLGEELSAGPFELVMSSGFFGFFAHAGVVRALEEVGLRPSLVGGSSAGALVAGMWGAGLSAEAIRERLFGLRREDFWDPDPSLGMAWGMRRLRPGLLRGERFERLLDDALDQVGVRDFADCAVRVRVVVWEVRRGRTVTLDEGALAPAIRASCTVPGMFQPALIGARYYLDGGLGDRAGIGAASDGARVLYHHLPARSPWRRFTPAQNRVPRRERLHVLHEPSLPRVTPFHLHRGPAAYALAREMALRTLDGPVVSAV